MFGEDILSKACQQNILEKIKVLDHV